MSIPLYDVLASTEHTSERHLVKIRVTSSRAVNVTTCVGRVHRDGLPVGRDSVVDEREAQQGLETRLGELLAHLSRRVQVEKVVERARVDRATVENVEHFLHELRRHEMRVRENVVAYELDHLTVDHLVVLDRLEWQFTVRNAFKYLQILRLLNDFLGIILNYIYFLLNKKSSNVFAKSIQIFSNAVSS